jgi:glucose-6-phosphate dehydrogenase assembly protein OpcA
MAGMNGPISAARFDGFTPIAVADVETELASRQIASSDDDRPLLRACSLNVIFYVEDGADATLASGIIDEVAGAHPIRAIGVMFDPAYGHDEVRAWIKVRCGAQVSGGRLASEEIALSAHPDGSARLASAVRGVMSPDLPVALWWRGGSPFLNRLFKAVAAVSDLIVVDSIRFGDGPPALDTLRRISELRGGAMAVADMNWKRTSTWRATLAACFDDRGVLALLPELDHCDIDYSLGSEGQPSEPSARSLLLAGWILTRLPAIGGHGDIEGRPSAWASRGAIVGLRLRSSTSKAAVTVAWEDAERGILATAVDRSGATMRRWRMHPDSDDEAVLLGRCLDSVSHDALFDAALRAD